MTTLIAVYNSDGCVGRCDYHCYSAMRKRCTCICGGRNHGVGRQTAMENVAACVGLTPEDLREFAAAHELRCDELIAIDRVAVPDARHAREVACLKINQLELPL